MKIQYSYLKNFLQTKLSQQKLVDVFTQVGFECEIDGDLIEFDITPNRGDVLSLKGLEREFCAYQVKKSKNQLETFKLKLNKDNQIINQIDHSGCGNYHLMLIEGLRKIKNLDVKKRSFIESAGVPLIHPLVDLGNYVMLEVGAPMHVFDLDKLELPINVKFPKSNKNSLKVIGGDVKDVQSSSLTIQDLRVGFVHAGFKELMHMPFVSKESFQQLNSKNWTAAELQNPINENEPFLRGSLFKSLFSAINNNVKKGYSSIKVFEVGNVFKKEKKGFSQSLHLAGITYHHEPIQTWSQKQFVYDFFSMKAEILKLLQTLGIHNAELQKTSSVTPFNENALAIFVDKQKIGLIGEIDLSITDKLIKKAAFGFEMYPEKISLVFKNPKIKKTSKFPLSSRDINIILDKSIAYQEVESLIAQGAIKHLTSFNLINTFEGKDIPQGSVSMTLRFIFQSNAKSLQESEINGSIQMILKLLEKRLNAKIRS